MDSSDRSGRSMNSSAFYISLRHSHWIKFTTGSVSVDQKALSGAFLMPFSIA